MRTSVIQSVGLCRMFPTSLLMLVASFFPNANAQEREWADFVEKDFPFFSSVLDARNLGEGWPQDNLTSRGLILNLGNGTWACFDTDLLRVSAIWQGDAVTPDSMAQISYHDAGTKTPAGQGRLPKIVGEPWVATGLYPGWQSGEEPSWSDPRPGAPDPKETSNGPVDPALGRFKAVEIHGGFTTLHYRVRGSSIAETISSTLIDGEAAVQRSFTIDRVGQPLWLIVGARPGDAEPGFQVKADSSLVDGRVPVRLAKVDGTIVVRVSASEQPVSFHVAMSNSGRIESWESQAVERSDRRWNRTLITSTELSDDAGAYVVDNIPLPNDNPWRRNIRLADIAFATDGGIAVVTFDGDVWMLSGLGGDLERIEWSRFASGLHEPMGICYRDDELFVCDRNGIWKLIDEDGNGEADRHVLFSNAFTQTAETREFATGMRVGPDGSFVIAKGGQQMSTIGIHNGTVLRVSPDGSSSEVIGWGLREPFIGVHPKTGMVVASDQQGHYVPSTPIHVIGEHSYHGFLSNLLPEQQYPAPIKEPLTWIPHPVCPSNVGLAWLVDARMGPLNGALMQLAYYRPELFVVVMNERTDAEQAAVMSVTRDLRFPPLNGAVNPADGQLYVAGYQIWGTEAPQISGLARLRFTGAESRIPHEVVPMDKGVLLRFDSPLDREIASDVDNYSLERWTYVRTHNYGSAHFLPDGSGKGQEAMVPSSSYVSADGKSVFIGVPGMAPVMQMRIGWSIRTVAGTELVDNAYTTPKHLAEFDSVAEGFGAIEVDLTPRVLAVAETKPATQEEGRKVAELMGCIACHSTDGSVIKRVGPSWKGLFGSERRFADGGRGVADADYLRESITEPAERIVRGFERTDSGMPSYAGILTDAQIDSIILYIESLR